MELVGQIAQLKGFALVLSQLPVTRPLKIAIYRTSSIGDVVLGTVCISMLALIDRPVQIYWIGRAPALALLASAFPSVQIIPFEQRQGASRLIDIAAELKFCDFLVDLQCNVRSKLLTILLGKLHGVPTFRARKMQLFRSRLLAEARIRGRKRPAPPAIRIPEIRQTDLMLKPLIQGLASVLPGEVIQRIVDGKVGPRLPISIGESAKPWQQELRLGVWLAVAPGASHSTKRAPLNKWCEILTEVGAKLANSGNEMAGLLFVGDDRDREFSLEISKEISWPGQILNMAGRLSLWETTQALVECKYLLSNDSSLAHIAEAVGCPVGILFGPTVEAFGFAPWQRSSRTFSALTGCRPCSKHGKIECRYGDQLCFQESPSQPVSAHILSVLGVG